MKLQNNITVPQKSRALLKLKTQTKRFLNDLIKISNHVTKENN